MEKDLLLDISYYGVDEVISLKELIKGVNEMIERIVSHKRYDIKFAKEKLINTNMQKLMKGEKITLI